MKNLEKSDYESFRRKWERITPYSEFDVLTEEQKEFVADAIKIENEVLKRSLAEVEERLVINGGYYNMLDMALDKVVYYYLSLKERGFVGDGNDLVFYIGDQYFKGEG